MSYWIFKANPERYRIDDRLRHPESRITWRVTRYRREIQSGDTAFIWRAGRDYRGMCAVLRIDTPPEAMPEAPFETTFYVVPDTEIVHRVWGQLVDRFECIRSSRFREIPGLAGLSVFHGYQATTNFRVSPEEAELLTAVIRDRRWRGSSWSDPGILRPNFRL